ncbi:PTS sugar transporter [Cryobacterium sp. PH29-G1]|uniref:PTS sugar transporter subunit IIB n=1 Tax=Cryobacterium sp. PH29-G1 TaxID=3046211 RepID=UPI0024BA6C87|nr:PTS sugar transporter [Cryobacterium sp. PH29-G1]MDJ0347795.1 PTS sugar transporter [Cryobacterium sp. PH29-G1]
MRIHVVCGAGASSTFVALRVRRSAAGRGLDVRVTAGSEFDLVDTLSVTDVLLVGPHLAERFDAIQLQAGLVGVRARLLPASVFTARDGEAALDLALDNDLTKTTKGSAHA